MDERYNIYAPDRSKDLEGWRYISIGRSVSRETLLRVLADQLPREIRSWWLTGPKALQFDMMVGTKIRCDDLVVERVQ